MYKHILVPMALDHGMSPKTLRLAHVLGAEDCKITALHIFEAPSGSVSAFLDENIVRASFEAAKLRLNEKIAEFKDVIPVVEKGHSARSIVDYALAHDVDCIVLGSHRPGLRDFFLGSTASRVVRHAPCAVHVSR